VITKDDRRHMIATAETLGWTVSFASGHDAIYFFHINKQGFNDGKDGLDIYFNRAGDMITDVYLRTGRMEQPTVRSIVDYLRSNA